MIRVLSALTIRGELAILASPSVVDLRCRDLSGSALFRPVLDSDPKDEIVSGVAD
jgi:hypothetical protein